MVDWEKQRKVFIDSCNDGTFRISKRRQKEILAEIDLAQKQESQKAR